MRPESVVSYISGADPPVASPPWIQANPVRGLTKSMAAPSWVKCVPCGTGRHVWPPSEVV